MTRTIREREKSANPEFARRHATANAPFPFAKRKRDGNLCATLQRALSDFLPIRSAFASFTGRITLATALGILGPAQREKNADRPRANRLAARLISFPPRFLLVSSTSAIFPFDYPPGSSVSGLRNARNALRLRTKRVTFPRALSLSLSRGLLDHGEIPISITTDRFAKRLAS